MNIITGISNAHEEEEISAYVKAGVDEFFIGYIPKIWSDVYGWEVSCNRREHSNYHYTTMEELENVVGLIHKLGRKVYLTFNAHEYNKEQLVLLTKIIKSIEHIPIDSFIVSNLALMLHLRNAGIDKPFHLSIAGGCNSMETIKFYNQNIGGIKRFILPRKLTVEEIEIIAQEAKKEGIKIESFGLSDACFFNDEYCFTWHGARNASFCQSPMYRHREPAPIVANRNWKKELPKTGIEVYFHRRSQIIDRIEDLNRKHDKKSEIKKNNKKDTPQKLYILSKIDKCGICAFQKFQEWGIDAVKLPLRGYTLEGNLGMVNLVKTVLNKQNATPEYCKDLLQAPDFCSGKNCYYNYPYKH